MPNELNQARIESVQCISSDGLHRMAYKDWGDIANPHILLCVHGVTRVSDDFDALARALMKDFRVICPDVVGRGRSGRLRTPENYNLPQYVSDMITLLARVTNGGNISYLGTSMGGMIGMCLASLPGNPIQQLIVNDVGPVLNVGALERIAQYVGQPIEFATFDEGLQYVRFASTTFGEQSDEEWCKFAKDVLRQGKDGKWRLHYDLNIALPILQTMAPEASKALEVAMWAAYDAITCPTLLLRGAESDLFQREVALQMIERGPKPKLIEFEKVGHAPTLVHSDQITVVKEFLLSNRH